MAPSEKNPGCSKNTGPPTRRRESIADHLASARERVRLPGGWSARLATPAFVADLIKRGIINGPVRVPKSTGVGGAQRFRPRDYRDLLQVISLKSQGIKHRSAWIAHLWLRGHDYPIERFRVALLDEIKTLRRIALTDFAPRGRLATIPFSKRFDDRVRKRPEGSLAPETTDIFEPLAALMIRPQAVKDVTIDVARAAEVVQSIIPKATFGLDEALADLYETYLSGATSVQPTTERVLRDLVAQTPVGRILELIEADSAIQKELVAIPARLRGMLDDGRNGAETSALIKTIKTAPPELFVRARVWYMAVRSGEIESMLAAAIPIAEPADVELLKLLADGAKANRLLCRANPRFAIHMFATFVHSDVPAELLSAPEPPDVRTMISKLRSGELDMRLRTRVSRPGDSE